MLKASFFKSSFVSQIASSFRSLGLLDDTMVDADLSPILASPPQSQKSPKVLKKQTKTKGCACIIMLIGRFLVATGVYLYTSIYSTRRQRYQAQLTVESVDKTKQNSFHFQLSRSITIEYEYDKSFQVTLCHNYHTIYPTLLKIWLPPAFQAFTFYC